MDVDLNAQPASNTSGAIKRIDEKSKDGEGWEDNILYAKGDDDEGQPVGWKDNNVYAVTDNTGSRKKDGRKISYLQLKQLCNYVIYL